MCYHKRNLYKEPRYEDFVANFKLSEEQKISLKEKLKDKKEEKMKLKERALPLEWTAEKFRLITERKLHPVNRNPNKAFSLRQQDTVEKISRNIQEMNQVTASPTLGTMLVCISDYESDHSTNEAAIDTKNPT